MNSVFSCSNNMVAAFGEAGVKISPAYIPAGTEGGAPTPAWLDEKGECIPGIYEGIPNECYHASPAVSNSKLKTFIESPAHYWHAYLDPEREEPKKQRPDYFVAGDLLHALCLEPEEVYGRYFCDLDPADYPDALRTAPAIEKALQDAGQPKKKSGEKKQDQVARLLEACPDAQVWDHMVSQHAASEDNKGKEGIPAAIWRKAHRAVEAVLNRDEARILLSDGLPELSIFARCPDTGMMLKARPDWLRLNDWIVDVKSASSAKPAFWARKASELGYHCQDAFYRHVYRIATGREAEGFGFITVEYDKAAICEPYEIDKEGKRLGEDIVQSALQSLVECQEKDVWPGYTAEGVTSLRIANWSRK